MSQDPYLNLTKVSRNGIFQSSTASNGPVAQDSPPRWNRLQVPGFQNLLYRLDFEESNPNVFTIFVTNMAQVWFEERVIGSMNEAYLAASKARFITLVHKLNHALNPASPNIKRSLLISPVSKNVESAPHNSQSPAYLGMANHQLELVVSEEPTPSTQHKPSGSQSQSRSITPAGPPFKWTFTLTLMDPTDHRRQLLLQSLILGLVGIVDTLFLQQRELYNTIHRKDLLLTDLLEAYGNSNYKPKRHAADLARFRPDEWASNWVTRKSDGWDELSNVVQRAVDTAQPFWGMHALGKHWQGSVSIINTKESFTTTTEAQHPAQRPISSGDESFFDSCDESFRLLVSRDDKQEYTVEAGRAESSSMSRKRKRENDRPQQVVVIEDSSGSETEDSFEDAKQKKQNILPQSQSSAYFPPLSQTNHQYDSQDSMFPIFSSQGFYSQDVSRSSLAYSQEHDFQSKSPVRVAENPKGISRGSSLPIRQASGSPSPTKIGAFRNIGTGVVGRLEPVHDLNLKLAATVKPTNKTQQCFTSRPDESPVSKRAKKTGAADTMEIEKQQKERLEKEFRNKRARASRQSRF